MIVFLQGGVGKIGRGDEKGARRRGEGKDRDYISDLFLEVRESSYGVPSCLLLC